MNSKQFLERWQSSSNQRRILQLLMLLVKQSANGRLQISMAELENIDIGHTLVLSINGDQLTLEFSEGPVEMYTLQEGSAAWQSKIARNDSQQSIPSGLHDTVTEHLAEPLAGAVKSDEELADLEERQQRLQQFRLEALEARRKPVFSGTVPIRQKVSKQ